MLFNSYEFILLFLPITFAGFFLISRKSHVAAGVWLALASLYFYGHWSPRSLPLLICSIALNFWVGLKLTSTHMAHRKAILVIAIIINLLVLGYFKYVNFFIDNANLLILSMNASPFHPLSVVLPIGISFFTFTQIGFLLDTYDGKVHEPDLIHYTLFVTFFPHLIAGPIINHKQVMPQFGEEATYRLSPRKISLGLAIFTLGLAKKILIADELSNYADVLFGSARDGETPKFLLSWLGSLSYTFQLYFDFSGYSDMAIGLSLLFGILLPINFDAPFKAQNMITFWQRWHMSLTTYISDYVYMPITLRFVRLGYGRPPHINTVLSLIIPTMTIFLLIGFWHGSKWTFVVFGGMHGFLLVINHLWRKRKFLVGRSRTTTSQKVLSWAITFLCVNATFVIFRSENVSTAIAIYEGMFGINGINVVGDGNLLNQIGNGIWQSLPLKSGYGSRYLALLLPASFFIVLSLPSTTELAQNSMNGLGNSQLLGKHWVPVFLGLLLAYCLFKLGNTSPFLYFQF